MSRKLSKEQRTYYRMLARCHDEDHPRYPWYGGRGILVCERWRRGFDVFLADMGKAPSPKHTIERKDNEKGYSPSNCVWATWKEQAQNRRTSVHLTFQGERLTIAQWAERLGVDRRVVWKRIDAGWSAEAAVTTPKAPRKPRIIPISNARRAA